MGSLAGLLIKGAVGELEPILARSGTALLGGAAVAGTASVSGSTTKSDSKATPITRSVPNTTQSCKKCPPDTGSEYQRKHGVNWNAYRYQHRITGFAFDEDHCRWSMEWKWLGTDFDGFQSSACLLQEAKGNYDQFLDGSIPKADKWFSGFDSMEQQSVEQGSVVRAHPPARLIWYFQTPLTQKKMAPVLASMGIPSILEP